MTFRIWLVFVFSLNFFVCMWLIIRNSFLQKKKIQNKMIIPSRINIPGSIDNTYTKESILNQNFGFVLSRQLLKMIWQCFFHGDLFLVWNVVSYKSLARENTKSHPFLKYLEKRKMITNTSKNYDFRCFWAPMIELKKKFQNVFVRSTFLESSFRAKSADFIRFWTLMIELEKWIRGSNVCAWSL